MRVGWLIGCAVVAAAGCAQGPYVPPLEIGGEPYAAQWTAPPGRAELLLVLEPGYARRCSHLRGTAQRLAAQGALVLCVDAPMAGGNPLLADALAGWLAGDPRGPEGRPLPRRIVVGGLSAGAAFAVRLGARLDERVPERLAGALLFDPVPVPGFTDDLRRVARQRAVWALLAEPHACNAMGAAVPALRAANVESVAAGPGSTHLDAEGDDGDAIGRLACGEPDARAVESLRAKAAAWTGAVVASGRTPSPP